MRGLLASQVLATVYLHIPERSTCKTKLIGLKYKNQGTAAR